MFIELTSFFINFKSYQLVKTNCVATTNQTACITLNIGKYTNYLEYAVNAVNALDAFKTYTALAHHLATLQAALPLLRPGSGWMGTVSIPR